MIPIFKSELKFQLQHSSWLILAILSFAFSLFVIVNQTPKGDIEQGGPYFLLHTFSIALTFLPIVAAVFVSHAAIRDFDSKMSSITFAAAPIGTVMKVRIYATFVSCLSIYLVFCFGIMSALAVSGNGSLLALYALSWALVVQLIPAALFFVAILFFVAVKGQAASWVYFSATFMFLIYQTFLNLTGSPIGTNDISIFGELPWLIALIDVVGVSVYFEAIKDWSIEQRNSQLPIEAILLTRVAVLVAALFLVSKFCQRTAKADLISGNKASWFKTSLMKIKSKFHFKKTPFFNFSSPTLVMFQLHWTLLIRSKITLSMLFILSTIICVEVLSAYAKLESLGVQALTSVLVTINQFSADSLPRLSSLFLLFLVSDICWRDKSSGANKILESIPVTLKQKYFGYLLVVNLLAFVFVGLGILISIVTQITSGGTPELIVYGELLILTVFPLIWFGSMAVLLHQMLPNKYWGLFVSLFLYFWTVTGLSGSLGAEHPLWTLGTTQKLLYSEIVSFDAAKQGFWTTQSLRFAILIFLSVIWLRANNQLTSFKLNHKGNSVVISGKFATGVTFMFLASTTILIWYEHNKSLWYQPIASVIQERVAYEKQYAAWQDKQSLSISEVTNNIALDIDNKSAVVTGSYLLTNHSNKPVTELLLTIPKEVAVNHLELPSAAQITSDSALGVYIYHFTKPLKKNEVINLNYQLTLTAPNNKNVRDNVIFNDFSYVRLARYLPWVGYAKHRELTNDKGRVENGLSVQQSASIDSFMQNREQLGVDYYHWSKITTNLVVPSGYEVIAPGELVRKVKLGQQLEYQFKTQQAVQNAPFFVVSKMATLRSEKEDTALEIHYPHRRKAHAYKHEEAMADMAAYGNKHFSALKVNTVKLVAFPEWFQATGYALPNVVFIGEKLGFHTHEHNAGFDHLYRRTVHEVAHQWWGRGLDGARTEGRGVLTETLAKYTEIMLLKHKYGSDYVRQLVEFEKMRYFSARNRSSKQELPLYRAKESHLIYSKGAIVMYKLYLELGETAINKALNKLLINHQYPLKPATTIDLITYLAEKQNNENKQLIYRLFYQVDLPELEEL